MNLNKLFPRLPIRTKLAIAFVALAGLPIAVLALVTGQVTLTRLRTLARETLQHDLENTARQVESRLAGAAQDANFLAEGLLTPTMRGSRDLHPALVTALEGFARGHPELLRALGVRAGGTVAALLDRQGLRLSPSEEEVSGVYYDLRAAQLASGEWIALPVEVLLKSHGGTTTGIAVLTPVHGVDGGYGGVIALEVAAEDLFAGIDAGSPYLTGVTALIDPEGFFLYHTERKNDWSVLLATLGDSGPPGQGLEARIGPRQGPFGGSEYLVATSILPLGNSTRPLRLYRAVPLATVNASVREFLTVAGVAGFLMVVLVLGLAIVAAQQFTDPIYRLRRAARALAAGEPRATLPIDTNDELEDLAQDFQEMARTITQHREELEDLVAARTRELATAHAELHDILANSADAIIGLDARGHVRLWNQGAERLFGYDGTECVGRHIDELIQPRDVSLQAERHFVSRELEQRGSVTDLHTRRRHKDGRLIPVSVSHTVIRDGENVVQGAALVIRDTSTQERFEEQMRRSERLATVSVLSAGLAHELNNPLGIIGNRLEIMATALGQGADPAVLARDVAVLQEHVRRLGSVTGHLLQVGRSDVPDGRSDRAPLASVHLSDVAGRTAALLERPLVTRGVHIVTEFDPALPPVRGRSQDLEVVCTNLMLNAADAMAAGGTITLTTACGSEGRIELHVRDTGPGVPAGIRERIFEPFFTTKGPGKGTGLGLALCRSIVERHGGQIRVGDVPGGGGSFVVAIPAASGEVG